MSLTTVQNAITRKKLNWQAGPTPVSDLDERGKKARLGLNVPEEVIENTRTAVAAANAAARAGPAMAAARAPSALDWRNNNGNWVTPVKDQQTCGSCVSFATCATVEARANIVCNNAGLGLDLSENQLFFCGCGNCCDSGWFFDQALTYAQNTGIALDAESPYTPVDKPCPPAPPKVRIRGWRAVYGTADRKSSLASRGPMVAGMRVYEDFYSYQGGVYRHASGAHVGNHAICVVGYSDAEECWILKNSWGAGFGEGGFFRIGYGDGSGTDTDFAFYEVDLDCPDVRPTTRCADYVPLLQRVLSSARSSRSLQSALRYHVCRRGRRPSMTDAQARVVRSTLLILRECPQYQSAFCRNLG